jgi:hypothetical protein
MLTFFRHIRKSLLGSGQARKYLLYAIGEIALVVIGILIALQINNWNEWRKDRAKEKIILYELEETISKNCTNLSNALRRLEFRNTRANSLLEFLSRNLPYEESLGKMIHYARIGTRFTLSHSGYEELKNAGFGILSSDSLKSEIINLYEFTYPEMQKIIAEVKITRDDFTNYILTHFEDIGDNEIDLRPIDHSFIINDQYFYSSVKAISRLRTYHMDLIGDSLKESQHVLQLIKEELGEE